MSSITSRFSVLLMVTSTAACGACGSGASQAHTEAPASAEGSADGLPSDTSSTSAAGDNPGDNAGDNTAEESAESVGDNAEAAAVAEDPAGFDVGPWNALLATYVTADGGFRYATLAANPADRAVLAQLVSAVAEADPAAEESDAGRLAFYINAYNILTVSAVLERFPIASVMDVPGFFDAATHRVAGAEMTLNGLENDIIRGQFHEPRIHFAVNCASTGCPWLDGTGFTAENLEASLERLTDAYVQRTTQVDARRRRVQVSKIFEWFAADFEAGGGVRAFLAAHLGEAQRALVEDPRTRITMFEYDWSLNGRP